jgi:hypothetical protein
MVFTAFSGNVLASMGIKALMHGLDVTNDFKYILVQIGSTIPTVTAEFLVKLDYYETISYPTNILYVTVEFIC